MARPAHFPAILVLLLSTLLLTDALTDFSSLRTPFSAHPLPEHHLRVALPSHIHTALPDAAALSAQVYELSPQHDTLYGPGNFSLTLNQLSETRTVRSHPKMSVRVNGRVVHERPQNLRLLSGDGFNVLLHGESGNTRVLHVYGNGLLLHPLDTTNMKHLDHQLHKHVLFNYDLRQGGGEQVQFDKVRTDDDMDTSDKAFMYMNTPTPVIVVGSPAPVSRQQGPPSASTSPDSNDDSGDVKTVSVTFNQQARRQDEDAMNLVNSVSAGLSRQTTDGPCTQANRYVVEISAAFERQFCALSGNEYLPTIGLIQATFDQANVIFRRDTCVEIALVDLEGYCAPEADPYAFIFNGLGTVYPGYSGTIFSRFRTFFSAQRTNVRRDIAYFFSAYLYNGGFSFGVAGSPGTCTGNAYGFVNGPNPFVLTHEVGHNLNCRHTDKLGDPNRQNVGIMNSSVVQSQLYFEQDSVDSIVDYVDTDSRTGCLSTGAPTCDESCAGSCTNDRCVVPVNPPAGFTSCKRADVSFLCLQRNNDGSITWYDIVDCPAPYVQVPFNVSDPEILCCADSGSTSTESVPSAGTRRIRLTVNDVLHFPVLVIENAIVQHGDPRVQTNSFFPSFSATCGGGNVNPTPTASPTTSVSVMTTVSATASRSADPTSSVSPPISESPTLSPSTSVVIESPSWSPTASASAARSSSNSPVVSPSTSNEPTPSSSTSITPSIVPGTPSVSVTSTSVPESPTMSPTSSPSVSSNGGPLAASLTCASGFFDNFGLRCRNIARGSLRINFRNIGRINLRLRLRFGTVEAFLRAGRRRTIRAFTLRMEGGPTDSFDFSMNHVGLRTVVEQYSTQVSSLPIPAGQTTCCGGNRIRAFMTVTACNRRGRCARTTEFTVRLTMRCGRLCRNTRRFTPIPMSASDRCPSCERI